MVEFIDEHRDVDGVEPICDVLPNAPSTHHEHPARRRDPEKRPARAKRDDDLRVEVRRVCGRELCGLRAVKVWRQLVRKDVVVACCTFERLMRGMGLRSAVRGRPWKLTTVADEAARRPA
jgi:hypothetical protein